MAEITLAAVSLSFQLFAGCIQGYQLLSDAAALPREYEYVRVRIKAEQHRLLDWACVAQMAESEESLVVGRAGKAMLLDVLEQQHNLLYRFGRFDSRLKPVARPLLREAEDGCGSSPITTAQVGAETSALAVEFPASPGLLKRALSYIKATRTIPARLRWAAWDKKQVEQLLSEIKALNDFLTEVLNKDQAEQLMELQIRTHYGIMQLNSSITQLLSIAQAESLLQPLVLAKLAPKSPPAGAGELASLARMKALNVAVSEGLPTDSVANDPELARCLEQADVDAFQLQKSDFIFVDDIPRQANGVLEDVRTEAVYYHTGSRSAEIYVWVEWRFETLVLASAGQGAEDAHDASGRWQIRRLAALVTLLKHGKSTRLFNAAQCLGYLREDISSEATRKGTRDYRYGFVFAKPRGFDSGTRPTSLRELLSRPSTCNITTSPTNQTPHHAQTTQPSLTDRAALALALAESLGRLHAVNWLHKGLRSHNVLFFLGDDAQSTWRQPIISGFELARPQGEPSWTSPGWPNPAHDLYKHPRVQADSGRNAGESEQKSRSECYSKEYDIYALGVVLVEIACWQPVHAILRIDLEQAGLRDTMPAKRRLMEAPVLEQVRFHMGDTMCHVIKACLGGLDLGEQVAGQVGIERDLSLQERFYSEVVQKLRSLRV
ncbi:prion-inhibition and propagation-domain-containing protein [Immersiella caudata]|uniref:Prion-inhibition and propagation-domain-containing protein n=1 Tax=Immersiella caudata TaxID=314043 RepID=A0AA39X518_9PEZI|nr:prion-inhibition and propagation-domain-containing protein [Immersiella caudata]